MKPIVKLVKFSPKNYKSQVRAGLDAIGLPKRLENAKVVLLKPNLVSDKEEYIANGSNTDIRLIEAVLDYLSSWKCKVAVVESETGTKLKGRKLEESLRKMGVLKLQKKYNFEVINLTHAKKRTLVRKNNLYLKKIDLAEISLDADLIINLPKLKTHKYATITCALKNMFGCVPDPLRVVYHHDIHKTLADLNREFIDRTVVVLDAIVGMEGNGPLFGSAVKMNLIGFSNDMLANDLVACKLMKIDDKRIKHLSYFQKFHPVMFKDIEYDGPILKDISRKFKLAHKNWFVRIEEQLMRNRFIVKILFSDFVRKNFTYPLRGIFDRARGGGFKWYVKK